MSAVISEKKENIGIIRLNRPEKSNSISRELLQNLNSAVLSFKNDPEIRCLMITSEGGKTFCAGADLEERSRMSREEVFQFLNDFRNLLHLLENLEIPTVSAMNGSAFGGGLELALATDIRLVKEDSVIGLTETKLGIIPGAGGTQRLARLIGKASAKDLIFRAARINSAEALRLGIVQRVIIDNFIDLSVEYCREICSSAPIAVRAAKKAVERGFSEDIERGLDIERECYLLTLDTEDRNEALLAFKEKRKPVFKGK
ncbi:MAG TPA: enoyl-CoA hydratase-related protein [Leptospiraceae bacterium]|nr:enoyl-CoA hydratase-related protein [Leptospiraceae bacterium]HMY66093.1 enoyl-CoA hydratase-related protein [Leptospiraceae bacterium]HMZ59258.1 enoyl-CoA hydratase-related protein [Leptospiraceae bacterium]HNF12933.1 enoyl-CoA hydratase-related protein [Leptospiraceae bacterium]HNF25889.1 enoyl-CoA hydratase-related protein [Leptospiraceae bacterium]